jgi:hypothetical protein
MRLRQKVTVGSFLCLSLVVIAMALVSVSDLPRMNAIDAPVYILFWQYMKASVAILMASLTAFPNMFVLQKEKKTREERMKRPVYSWQNWGHRTKSNDAEEGLPEVPRAIITGIRSFIRGYDRTAIEKSEYFSDVESSRTSQIAGGSFITKASV